MDSRPSIGVVTVTHNSAHVLDGFLDQLSAETAENETRVVVVDSGSSAIGETKRISRQSGAAFVPILENVGYGTASNRGAQGLNVDWLAFVNPDVHVTAATLHYLAQLAGELHLAAIAPNIVRDSADVDGPLTGGIIEGALLSGACLVVAWDAFEVLGGFDERFFMFAEEEDLLLRLTKAGYRYGLASGVRVFSPGGASSEGVSRRWGLAQREGLGRMQLLLKHRGGIAAVAAMLRTGWRIMTWSSLSPRNASVVQVTHGFRRVIALRSSPPHRSDWSAMP